MASAGETGARRSAEIQRLTIMDDVTSLYSEAVLTYRLQQGPYPSPPTPPGPDGDGRRAAAALREAFELRRGEVVFLVGSNGSGKTTFMNVLAGLLDPTEGTIEVDGKVLTPEDMGVYRAQFSAIFTQFHVFRPLYGLEAVTPEQADETIEKVHLSGITSIRSEGVSRLDLSAGQRRRLALAIALLEDRNVLVLDEFVADQDPEKRDYFFRTLLPWLKQQGKTVVVSTHDLAWLECCDRVISFENGQMTEHARAPAMEAAS